tara:strand:- start:7051 stop:7482 length:432 start_codon:yes stop_codon:yes gene_type:complete
MKNTFYFLSVLVLFLTPKATYCQTVKNVPTQNNKLFVRIAKIEIDSVQLEKYKEFLKEEIEASIRIEPGVLTLYAVSEKNNPTHIEIFETYENIDAYKSHIQTAHFLKYKMGTKDMVKRLELIETDPILLGAKGSPSQLRNNK